LLIMIACFVFAGLQAVKIIKDEYSFLDVFFLVTFLSIGILYLVFYLKQHKS
jgi:hypothetical protein